MIETHDIQPNPGWGQICESCKNRHQELDCDFPCHKVVDYGLTPHPKHGHMLLPNYRRFSDFSETCSDFES